MIRMMRDTDSSTATAGFDESPTYQVSQRAAFSELTSLVESGRVTGIAEINVNHVTGIEDSVELSIRFNARLRSGSYIMMIERFFNDYSAMRCLLYLFDLLASEGLATRAEIAKWRRDLMVSVG